MTATPQTSMSRWVLLGRLSCQWEFPACNAAAGQDGCLSPVEGKGDDVAGYRYAHDN